MENTTYIALSKQRMLQRNLEIIANNVANMNTAGFRSQNLAFSEYVSKSGSGADPVSMVSDGGQYQSTAPGAIQKTGNDFDIALNGPGFLGVIGPGGNTVYTRAGNLQMDAEGTLMTGSGYKLAGDIKIPANSMQISIDEKGVISNQDGEIGQLSIVEFEDDKHLTALGENLYTTNSPVKEAENTRVAQGSLEGSNVNGVMEMTNMIETLRTFQRVQKMLSSENDLLRSAIQKLTKV